MATFKERIEDLAGAIPSTADGAQFMNDGVVDVIDRLAVVAPHMMPIFAATTAVAKTGTTLPSPHILDVELADTKAFMIPQSMSKKAADSDSIYYATSTSPVFYVANDTIKILPASSGVLSYAKYGSVTNFATTTSSISGFPTYLYELPILYAAARVCEHNMAIATQPSDPDLPVLPTTVTISTNSETLPTFNTPSPFVAPALPDDADIDFSDVPTAPSFIMPVLSLTALGALSDLSSPFVAPTAPTISANTVGFTYNDNAPEYTAPTFAIPIPPPYPTELDWSGVTQTLTSVTLPDEVTLPTLVLNSFPDLVAFSPTSIATLPDEISAITVSDQTPPIYSWTAPSLSTEFGELATFLDTNEDVELAMAKIQEMQLKVSQYQQTLTSAQNDFNALVQDYQGKLQVALKNADIDLSEYSSNIQRHRSSLEQYSTEVNKFTSQNQILVSRWQAEATNSIQRWSVEVSATVNKYQADIQRASSLTSTEIAALNAQITLAIQKNQAYIAEYNAKLQQYSSDITFAIQKYNAEMSSAVNDFNEANTQYQAILQKAIRDAELAESSDSRELQKYSQEIQAAQAAVSSAVQHHQANVVEKVINVWRTNTQNDLAEYTQSINAEAQRVQADLSVYAREIEKATSKYQAETGYDLSKFSAGVNGATAEHSSALGAETARYNGEISAYNAEAQRTYTHNQAQLSKYSAEVQAYAAEANNALQKFAALMNKANADYTWNKERAAYLKAQYNEKFAKYAGKG